jgi:hypothetical protein
MAGTAWPGQRAAQTRGRTRVFPWGEAAVRIDTVSLDTTRRGAMNMTEDHSSGARGRVQQAAELATYVVERGKPLLTLAE